MPTSDSNPEQSSHAQPLLWPTLTLTAQAPDSASFDLHIAPTLAWFEGHFPGQPVLPGVTQTHWACLLSQQTFSLHEPVEELKKLKFKSPVLPGSNISLELRYRSERHQVSFAYANEHTDFSSGIIQFTNSSAHR